MAVIERINRGSNLNKGAGLGFYPREQYLVSQSKVGLPVQEGWATPRNKLPSFQLWLKEEEFVNLSYKSTRTGAIHPISIQGGLTPVAIEDNSGDVYVYSSTQDLLLPTIPPCGQYVIILQVLARGIDQTTMSTYYSDEIQAF